MNFEFKSINDVAPSTGGAYGRFGKNDATLTKFEYTDAGGASGASQDALLVTFKVGEADFNYRIFPPKVFGSMDVNSEEYKAALKKAEDQVSTAISQITEAIVDPSLIISTLNASKPNSFKDYVQVMERLIKNTANWDKKELDLFLNWQKTPGTNQNKTFLEVPRQTILNYSNSIFVTAKKSGTWTEDTTDGKLLYKNESGEIHPIKRDKWFMSQNYAKRVDLEKDNAPSESAASSPAKEDW